MKFKKKNFAAVCAALSLLIIAAALIIYPERYVQSCFNGFALWAECVLPSLFPFMIVTLIFIKSGAAQRASAPLAKVSAKLNLPEVFAVCFIISACSGYPAGSRVVREFYDGGEIDGRECKKLSALCSTSGPLFIIGTVGAKCFGDKITGAAIFAAHLLSVVIIALIYSLIVKTPPKKAKPRLYKGGDILYDCFYSAVISVCVAGGFIAFFTCVSQIANDFNFLYPLEKPLSLLLGGELSRAVCFGLIEATNGCALTAACGGALAVPCAGFIITFGGACILLQQLCYLTGARVSVKFFILIKLLQAALCFLLLLPFALIRA